MFVGVLVTPLRLKLKYKPQKQPAEVFRKILQVHRKTPVLEFRFNKVTVFKTSNFIKKRLQHSCFSVKFAKFLKSAILKNICEQLLQKLAFC